MDPQDRAEVVLCMHKALMAECQTVESIVSQPAGKDVPAWVCNCRSHFHKLHTYLREHMFHEETGGFMNDALERRPTLTHRVEQLKQEHIEVRAACEEIENALLVDEQVSLKRANRIRERIANLLARIYEHEKTENHLLQDAFFVDIGTND